MTSTAPFIDAVTPVGWALLCGSLAAGVGTLALIWYLDRHRGAPGAAWFMATLGAQALWIFAYTGGLVVEAPFWRASAEAAMWVGIAWLGPLFLAFALAYTGRNSLVRSWGFPLVFAPAAVTAALAATHPFHSLLWQNFRPAAVFGLATVQYTLQPWGYVAAVVSLGTAGVGVLLLVETVVSYGPLYRNEAIAVALSTVAPAGAFVVWLSGVGPWPSLNLAAVLFLPHVLLDAYAFVGTHMFDTNPTTQRAAERSALRDLDDPLLVVDPEERVVNMNTQARELFAAAEIGLPFPVAPLVGTDLGTLRNGGEFVPGGRDEVYAVSTTQLTDPTGSEVGELFVFYDITTVRRQKQRLSVLNRILRHNLRNRLNVAQGRAELIESETTDPSIRTHTAAIRQANEKLLSIGERIRDFQNVMDRGRTISTVDPVALAERVATSVNEAYPDARIDLETDIDERQLNTDREIVGLVLRNLLDNAIVHSSQAAPAVELHVTDPIDQRVVYEIRDRNDRIPNMEIDTLDADEESALHHGQGIGLWIVTWCLEYVDGDIRFAYDDGNVVFVMLPRGEPASSSPD